MRVRIPVTGFAMRSPSGVTDSNMSRKGLSHEGLFHFTNPSFLFIDPESIAVEKGNARTIVSSVFKSLQAF